MSGWYKLDATDARNLAEVASTFTDRRSARKRQHMLLFTYSKINGRGLPCPHFRVGYRTIAMECDVSEKAARSFIAALERDGYVVRVGSRDDGKVPKRTFWWIAQEAGVSQTLPKVGQTPLPQLGQTPLPKVESVRADPAPQTPPVRADPSALNPPNKGSQQSTEYSERAVGYVHSALAEDCPLYSCATEEPSEPEVPRRSRTEEALAWYRENGLPDPPEIPPMPGGDG